MTLDLGTLHLSSALSRAAYLVVFTTVALRQPREMCLWHWIGAIVASMIGSTIMARVPTSRWLHPTEAFTIYSFYLSSLVLSWSGLRLFNDRVVKPSTIGTLTVAPGAVYVIALLIHASMRTALASVFGFCLAYSTMAVVEALREPSGPRLWSRYIVAAAFVCYGLVFLLTFCVLVATGIPMNSPESGETSMIVDQGLGILVYFGYIAMAKERAVRQIHHLIGTDPLTGLANRRGLHMAFDRQRKTLAGGQASGVLLADIDHFKAINDTYGHEAGDRVLAIFAARLRNALREDDIVARWGGEEFLAVLPQTDVDHMVAAAERVRAAVASTPFVLSDGQEIRATVSIGFAEITRGLSSFEDATRRADAALYEAKTGGRNKVCGGVLVSGMPASIDCAA